MKITIQAILFALLISVWGCSPSSPTHWTATASSKGFTSSKGILLTGNDRLSTPNTFHTPVTINIVAKTDSTNLRLAYAADQVIFNWEMDKKQLRVDGGPADGQHQPGMGNIPVGKFVAIRWVVTPTSQTIYVNNELRFSHNGDYTGLNRCVSVFPAQGSKVTVKSITVE